MTGPLLLSSAIILGTRHGVRLPRPATRGATVASQALVGVLLAAAVIGQRALLQGTSVQATLEWEVVLAAALAVLIAFPLLQRRSVVARLSALGRETPIRRTAAVAAAMCFASIWMLRAVMTDRLTGDAAGLNLPFTFNDAIAVLDGRTPLVDYHLIYAKLLPYVTAAVLGTFGTSTLVYSAFMAMLNVLVLMAVYALLRRVARSSVAALLLFIPFVATSDIAFSTIRAGELGPMTLSATWPMRYGGAYLLAWLTVRHLDGCTPKRRWVLFMIGGLAAVNSLEFGVSAFVATVVALGFARPPRSATSVIRLAADAATGAAIAVALVCLVTFARARALPDLSMLFEWPNIFTRLGWFSFPLHVWGLHLAIYATFVAAIAVAAIQVVQSKKDPLLTGMLTWSGVFGLLNAGYFVSNPDVTKLTTLLSAWSFSIVLLTIVCARALAARGWRHPTYGELLVFLGFGICVCLVGRVSPPHEQIARLTQPHSDPSYLTVVESFVDQLTRRGEKVAILVPMSYRVSHDLDLDNVSPYGFMNEIVTRSQMETLIDALRRERVLSVFVPAPGSRLLQEGDAAPQQLDMLVDIGFRAIASQYGVWRMHRIVTPARPGS
jgi:hypothetical protein